jgi:hypothetical protein
MGLFIEENILNAIRELLAGRVNEILGELEDGIPPVEFGQSGFTGLPAEFRQSRNSAMPTISLTACERTEKERIVRLDAYSLTVAFTVPEGPSDQRSDAERYCYAYAASVGMALGEDPTLGGVVDRAALTGKKYMPPKHPGTEGDWEVVLTLRINVEQVTGNNE